MFDDTAQKIWKKQYAIHKDETIEEGFKRVSKIALNETTREVVLQRMLEKKFCPGGRILAGAETEHGNTLNCYVFASDTGKYQSLDDVNDLTLKIARTTKVGGGVGINLDPFSSKKKAITKHLPPVHLVINKDHADAENLSKWQFTDVTKPEGFQIVADRPKRAVTSIKLVDSKEGFLMGKDAKLYTVEDSLDSIIQTPFNIMKDLENGQNISEIYVDFSNLRPEGADIKGSGGTSSGVASFAIEIFDNFLNWYQLGAQTAGPVAALRYVFAPTLRAVRQGGCLPASALIHTTRGLVSIQDVNVGDQVYTFGGVKDVTFKWDKGEQKLLTVKGRGMEFTATPEHRMAVLRDAEVTYLPMKSIKPGDTLLVSHQVHEFNTEARLPEFDIVTDKQAREIIIPELDTEMAWFIGYFQGNGYAGLDKKAVALSFNTQYFESFGADLKQRLQTQLERFGVTTQFTQAENENTSTIRAHSSQLCKYINKHIKKPKTELSVPEFIMNAPVAIRSAYIAGLLDSDGSVLTKPVRLLTTVYPEFASQVQKVLFSLGIPVRHTSEKRQNESHKDLHTLSLVGFKDEYNQRISPFSLKGVLEKKKLSFDYSVPKDSVKLEHKQYARKWSGQGNMGYHMFKECGGNLPGVPVKVLEVVEAEPERTWDIEVAGEENYIANGFHTHNSRRGAGMGTLSIEHEDWYDFLTCKDLDREANEGDISTFNISFLVPDKYMAEYEIPQERQNAIKLLLTEYEQQDRIHSADPVKRSELAHHTLQQLAQWDLNEPTLRIIATSMHAWMTGEPGLLFVDKINAQNPLLTIDGPIKSTNPCLTGDTLILTLDGPRRFDELAAEGKDVLVWCVDKETNEPKLSKMVRPHKTQENVDVLEIEFDSGLKVRATPEHNFFTLQRNKVQAKDLKPGQSVAAFAIHQHRDGHLRVVRNRKSDDTVQQHFLHRLAATYYGLDLSDGRVVHHKDGNKLNQSRENLTTLMPTEHNREHFAERVRNGFFHGSPGPKAQKVLQYDHVVNHKVVAVRPAGKADVYNGMVEDYHTYVVVDPVPVGKSYISGILSANCGEIPLAPGEPCDLGAINLAAYVINGVFDRAAFVSDIRYYMDFLDDNLDYCKHPVELARKMSLRNRRVGLGIMGLGDALIKLGITYGSEEALKWTEDIMALMGNVSFSWSVESTHQKGEPEWSKLATEAGTLQIPRRNVATLTIAPTGTTAMIMGVSSGVEPIYSPLIYRKVGSEYITIVHPLLQEALQDVHPPVELRDHNVRDSLEWDWDKVAMALSDAAGSVKDLTWIPQHLREVFVFANEIPVEDHVQMQGAAQRGMDHWGIGNSISKTINMDNKATVLDVLEAYVLSHTEDCKGITVYRDGSRQFQVLSTSVEKKEEARPDNGDFPDGENPENQVNETAVQSSVVRTNPSTAFIYKMQLNNQSWYVTPGFNHEGKVVEVFINPPKGESFLMTTASVLGRLISLGLKHGASLEDIVDSLDGHHDDTGGWMYGIQKPQVVSSVYDGFAEILKEHIGHTVITVDQTQAKPKKGLEKCSECGEKQFNKSECVCYACGATRCG